MKKRYGGQKRLMHIAGGNQLVQSLVPSSRVTSTFHMRVRNRGGFDVTDDVGAALTRTEWYRSVALPHPSVTKYAYHFTIHRTLNDSDEEQRSGRTDLVNFIPTNLPPDITLSQYQPSSPPSPHSNLRQFIPKLYCNVYAVRSHTDYDHVVSHKSLTSLHHKCRHSVWDNPT
ncbi:unnamed protein product [Hydatigera taeniaeformis]|uniref:ApaG domain-containing protein n=1 Tax=Hydatigena taeniaeformis TaxID=6205 RepID=A0A0R3WLQ5_HYDTA|nr:unnamed protein product [Hydatigera taeniaeformis]